MAVATYDAPTGLDFDLQHLGALGARELELVLLLGQLKTADLYWG